MNFTHKRCNIHDISLEHLLLSRWERSLTDDKIDQPFCIPMFSCQCYFRTDVA
jgi:hypothetical protein